VNVWFFYLILSLDTSSSSYDGDVINNNIRGSTTPVAAKGVDPFDIVSTRHHVNLVRNEFYTRYGGKEESLAMLKRGLRTFEKTDGKGGSDEHSSSKLEGLAFDGESARATAYRLLNVMIDNEHHYQQEQGEFVMAFAGYSVTVGRGNHFSQSFPFILESILKPILELPPFNIKLIVRNSAIGGIPSFPYGWCLQNFLGEDAHAISWDYGMNEGNGAGGLESYVRQSLMMPNAPPLFILVDLKRPRLDVLHKYVNMGYLSDPIALGGKEAVNKQLLALPEKDRPVGLQQWDEWGAPKGSPGQSPWHPKKMEHELMGWLLGMYLLDAVDVALSILETDENWREKLLHDRQYPNSAMGDASQNGEVILPPPITDVSSTGVTSLLHGAPLESDATKWHMHRISCRTSFLPNISGHLDSIVLSGVTKDEEDMLQPRDDSLFNGGWVMDVGSVERETKVKVEKVGGLGYIDMKTALYGIPSSGTLKLWLPYELKGKTTMDNDAATNYFNAVVLCEVNEKRTDKECNMLTDLTFLVGDAAVPKESVSQIKGVASYLKKDICIHVGIPIEAKVSSKDQGFGLTVDVTVSGSGVTRESGACSISHVIWEHQ